MTPVSQSNLVAISSCFFLPTIWVTTTTSLDYNNDIGAVRRLLGETERYMKGVPRKLVANRKNRTSCFLPSVSPSVHRSIRLLAPKDRLSQWHGGLPDVWTHCVRAKDRSQRFSIHNLTNVPSQIKFMRRIEPRAAFQLRFD